MSVQLPMVPKERAAPSDGDKVIRPRLTAFECEIICTALRQYRAGKGGATKMAIADDLIWRLTDRVPGRRA